MLLRYVAITKVQIIIAIASLTRIQSISNVTDHLDNTYRLSTRIGVIYVTLTLDQCLLQSVFLLFVFTLLLTTISIKSFLYLVIT